MVTWFPTGDGKDLITLLCHVWIECLVSLPFDRRVNCHETGKPYVICDSRSHSNLPQDLNGNVGCNSLSFFLKRNLSYESSPRFWMCMILVI